MVRVGELASITRESIFLSPTEAMLNLSLPRETQYEGPLQTLRLRRQPEGVCSVYWLHAYLARADPLRHQVKGSRMFIGLKKKSLMLRLGDLLWQDGTKSCLQKSGVDVALYSAHSTRGARTSAAVAAGIPIDSVLKKANWASVTTFNRFYNRPLATAQTVSDGTVASVLLESLVQSS